MDKNLVQEFNGKNSLSQILFNYLRQNEILISGNNTANLTMKMVRKLIFKEGILVNSKKKYDDTYKIQNNDLIVIPRLGIRFKCVKNVDFTEFRQPSKMKRADENEKINPKEINNSVQIESIETAEEIDKYITDYLDNKLQCSSFADILATNDTKKAFCNIIILFELKDFDKIKETELGSQLINFIKETFHNSHLSKELQLPQTKSSFSGFIIDSLIKEKKEKEKEINLLFSEAKNGLYDQSLNKLHQNYNKIITKQSFQFLVAPLLDNNLSSRISIENLTKPILEATAKIDDESRYGYYDSEKTIYEDYLHKVEHSDEYNKSFYFEIGNYLFNLFKEVCDATIEKVPSLIITATSKKYNFKNLLQTKHDLYLNIKNIGDGYGKNIKITSQCNSFKFHDISVGTLKSDEIREIKIPAIIIQSDEFNSCLTVLIEWEESSERKKSKEITVKLESQEVEVPWESLISKQNPYTIQEIEDVSKLFGRNEILTELKNNIYSENIQNYKIWGQKRVGKSSVVRTLKSLFKDDEKKIIVYRRIGGLRSIDPTKTLNNLGDALTSEIINQIDVKIKDHHLRDKLKSLPIPVFDGSLYPLENYLNRLHLLDNSLKFVFIVDEFDRINDIFFRPGDYCETLSQSIGKGFNLENYIGFILVGSENMQLLDRQGMNYNNYQQRRIDTFNKETQFISYKKIIIEPVKPYLNFTEESLDILHDFTDGNPYFTNLICQEIFNKACKNEDYSIDKNFVSEVINYICLTYKEKEHFEHFWGDSLTQETEIKKEAKTDIRRRILITYGWLCSLENNNYPTRIELLKNFRTPDKKEFTIEKYEVENTINEFEARNIFTQAFQRIRIKPKLFEQWLCGPGKSLMIVGISDLEQYNREKQIELENSIKNEELNRLSEKFLYQGKRIPIEKFEEFFNQFEGVFEQRRIFRLLDLMNYVTQEQIHDFFRNNQKIIFKSQKIHVKEGVKTLYREKIELFSFSKNIEEYHQIIDSFKTISRIRATKKINRSIDDIDTHKKNEVEEIIVLEPVIDNFEFIKSEFLELIEKTTSLNIDIRLVCLIISTTAKTEIIRLTAGFSNVRRIIFQEIEDTNLKPFIAGTEIFENREESYQALAVVRKFFPTINNKSILLLFDPICPSMSCPILWCKTSHFKPIFYNAFGKLETYNTDVNGEKGNEVLRDRVYFANKRLIQTINPFLINFLKNKAEKDGKKGEDNWFHLDYLPQPIMENIIQKWIGERQTNSKDTYFDLIHYKDIIKKNKEILSLFEIKEGSADKLRWIETLNETRRDPAHPEKPAPEIEETEYFEKTVDEILQRLKSYSL